MSNAPVMILAGGFGTRLHSVVSRIPKVMAPVNGKPFLDLLINNLSNQGVKKIILLTGYLGELVESYIKNSKIDKKLNLTITIVKEEEPLGTGGAIANALTKLSIKNNFITINGDTWIDNFYNKLINCDSSALGLVKVKDVSRYGQVELNTVNHRITSFSEKKNKSLSGWINSGALYTNSNHFNIINKKIFSLEHDLLPKLVDKGLLIAVKLKSAFIDIGIPSDYQYFENNLNFFKNND